MGCVCSGNLDDQLFSLDLNARSLYAVAVAILVASTAVAQQPGRIRGQIEKADGR